MDRAKIAVLYHTIKYLKPIQIYYRLYYFVRNRCFKMVYNKKLSSQPTPLVWENIISNTNTFLSEHSFTFLNISKNFKKEIDWNYEEFGKLWTFNLNYFDFLNQNKINVKEGLVLIKDYIAKDNLLKDGKAAYPISLRGINWVKFLSKNKILDNEINQNLYNHYQILIDNLEYHLLGNHLLENGFSLLFGGYYFKDNTFYKNGNKILKKELQEQILNDGAHFELSPMYHQIMLFRVLDCIHLIKFNLWKDDDLLSFLNDVASKMLSWLKEVTFNNGDIPMVNDSSFGIAPKTEELLNYGEKLGLKPLPIKLLDSGYRMFKRENIELFIDVGNVGASYQPAHVHSDTFNFILYVNNQPIFVDTGVSTYEKNDLRQIERSTSSHNTVQVGNIEQTQVWSGFRVAKRAKIIDLKESDCSVSATHDGYKPLRVLHTRKFEVEKNIIIITDSFKENKEFNKIALFHFHPQVKIVILDNNTILLEGKKLKIIFSGDILKIEKEIYNFAIGFNNTVEAYKIKVFFKKSLKTKIEL